VPALQLDRECTQLCTLADKHRSTWAPLLPLISVAWRSYRLLMRVRIRETAVLPMERGEVFEFLVSQEGFETFAGWGPIPGIAKVENLGGSFTEPGSFIAVTNTDGSAHRECVVSCERPARYAIRIQDFSSPFRLLIRHADEVWTLEEHGEGCLLDRSFEFELRSALLCPLSFLIAQGPFRAAVRRHHRILRAWADARRPPGGTP